MDQSTIDFFVEVNHAMTVVLDSVTDLTEHHRGAHVLVGSHGGLATGVAAARFGVRSLICCDAGIGLDRAGIAALQYLDDLGIPAASIAHETARIGDAHDVLARGIISWANGRALDLNVSPDCPAAEATTRLKRATGTPDLSEVSGASFERSVLHSGYNDVLLCDSASQISDADSGRIVITGSHGGMPGGDPARAAKADLALAIFNDAGIGIEGAGISRLPILDQRGIPAACVDCMTARIGEARSTYETGILSTVNHSAESTGLTSGLPVKDAIRIFNANNSRLSS